MRDKARLRATVRKIERALGGRGCPVCHGESKAHRGDRKMRANRDVGMTSIWSALRRLYQRIWTTAQTRQTIHPSFTEVEIC